MKKNKITLTILLIPQLAVSFLLLAGIINGMIQSLGIIPVLGLNQPTFQYYREILMSPDMIESLLYSLKTSCICAICSTVVGVFLCAVFVTGKKSRSIGARLLKIPIIVPHITVALYTVIIFSQNGMAARVAQMLGIIKEQQDFPQLLYDTNGVGIILAYLWKEIPFIVFVCLTLMSNINDHLGEAARNLGAGKWTAFFQITLPLCKNTICSSFLIVFTFSLGAYELPLLLGATLPKALPVLAYQEYLHPDMQHRPYAMAINGVIIMITLASSAVYYFLMIRNLKDIKQVGIEKNGKE